MKLIYVSNQRLPTEKAYGIQIAKMCEAFGDLMQTTLLVPFRKNQIHKSIYQFYGVKKNFSLVRLSILDFYWPGKLDRVAVIGKSIISAIILACYVLFKKADVIFSRDELPLYFLSFFRCGLMFEAHRFSTKRQFFYRRFQLTGMKIIVISQGIKEDFIAFGYPREKILVAHDGVDLSKFIIPTSRTEAREILSLPTHDSIVGYVGHLRTMGMEKGVDLLLIVLKMLRAQKQQISLGIVGGTPEDIEIYRAQASRLGIADAVIFFGRKEHSEIPLYLKAFDVLTMPFPNKPHYEKYMSPLKMFEYMASGRPIVASSLRSVREVLNEHNSVLVNPDNANALKEGIERILGDQQLAETISHQALQDVSKYSWINRAKIMKEFMWT